MTDLRTAAQQALEALEYYQHRRLEWDYSDEVAITALKAALAEPVQEPVAWSHINGTSDTKWHPPQRKPLTEEEISSLWDGHVVPVFGKNGINPIVFTRAIERAHGIGEHQ